MKASSYTLFWTGFTQDGRPVRIYRKLVKHKSGLYYDLRAVETNPLRTTLGEFAEVVYSETARDLPDDRACQTQINQWCNLYQWRKDAPVAVVQEALL